MNFIAKLLTTAIAISFSITASGASLSETLAHSVSDELFDWDNHSETLSAEFEAQVEADIVDPVLWEADLAEEMAQMGPFCDPVPNTCLAVTIDLDGGCHFLETNLSCDDKAAPGITLRNGAVLFMRGNSVTALGNTNMGAGIQLEGPAALIGGFGATVSGFGDGIVAKGSFNTVKHVTVSDNVNDGLRLQEDDAAFEPIKFNRIQFIKADNNGAPNGMPNGGAGVSFLADNDVTEIKHNRLSHIIAKENDFGVKVETFAEEIKGNKFSYIITNDNETGVSFGTEASGKNVATHIHHIIANENTLEGVNVGAIISAGDLSVKIDHIIANGNGNEGILMGLIFANNFVDGTGQVNTKIRHLVANRNGGTGIKMGFIGFNIGAFGSEESDVSLPFNKTEALADLDTSWWAPQVKVDIDYLVANRNANFGIDIDTIQLGSPFVGNLKANLHHFVAIANEGDRGIRIHNIQTTAPSEPEAANLKVNIHHLIANQHDAMSAWGIDISNIQSIAANGKTGDIKANLHHFIANRNGERGVAIQNIISNADNTGNITANIDHIIANRNGDQLGIMIQDIFSASTISSGDVRSNIKRLIAKGNDGAGISIGGIFNQVGRTETTITDLIANSNAAEGIIIGTILGLAEEVNTTIRRLIANHNRKEDVGFGGEAGIVFFELINADISHLITRHNGNFKEGVLADGISFLGIVSQSKLRFSKASFNTRHGVHITDSINEMNRITFNVARLNQDRDFQDDNVDCGSNMWGLNLNTAGLLLGCPS